MEPFWLLLLGPVVLLPGRIVPLAYHPLCVAGLFLFWPIRWIVWQRTAAARERGFLHRSLFPLQSPLSVSLLVILCWLPVNLFVAVDPALSWMAAGYLLYGLTLFVAVINWPPTQRRPELIAYVLGAAGVALVVAMPLVVQWKSTLRLFDLALYRQGEVGSGFQFESAHSNVLAGGLLLILPFLVAVAAAPADARSDTNAPGWLRLVSLLGALAVAGAIVLTQSRGAYLGSAVALGLLAVTVRPRLLWGLIPLLGLSIILAVTGAADQTLATLVSNLGQDGTLGGWEGRLDTWRNSLLALRDFPLTGIGVGTYTVLMPQLYPLPYAIEWYPHAHNLLMQIGLDLGLPGLIAYLAVVLGAAATVTKLVRQRHRLPPLHRLLALASLAAMAAFLTHGILDAVLWGTKIAFLPWLLYALIDTLGTGAANLPTNAEKCAP